MDNRFRLSIIHKTKVLVTAYLDQQPNNNTQTIAVETAMELPLVDPVSSEDFGLPLVGIVDLVIEDDDGSIIVDFILGDMTGDGLVNLDDVPAFIQALVNRTAYDAQGYVTNTDAAGDIDGSGTFDLGDTALFSGLFGGPTSASAVPEPTTLSLAIVLLLGIVIRPRRRA